MPLAATAHCWTTGPFCTEAWSAAAPILERTYALPFLAELADGTLAPEVFVDYVRQDAFYLAEYSRALATLAAKAPDAGAGEFWAGSAHIAVAEEKTLHAQLMADPVLADCPRPSAPTATTRGYMHGLLAAAAYEPYEVGAAAVLPCFWIYAEVGLRLADRAAASSGHPYARWMAEYGDPAFVASTQRAIDLVDEAAAAASPRVRERMLEAFLDASHWEERFWTAPYEREAWTR